MKMKKLKSIWAVVILLMVFTSCKRDNSSTALNLEDDEAAEIVASFICTDNGGNSGLFMDAVFYSENLDSPEKVFREELYDTTFTITNQAGAKINYSYTVSYEYGFKYNSQMAAFEFYMDYNSNGTYSSARMKSSDSSKGNLILNGLDQDETSYIINGSISRTGNQTTFFRDEKSVTGTLLFNFNEIKIDKTDYEIKSGSGTLTFSGKTSDDLAFSFTGSVEYTANESIILTLNGEVYTIDLISGEIQ
jgi:hypothetical protein